MATCDPNTVIQPCWACRSPQELQAAMVGLLCDISTNGGGGGNTIWQEAAGVITPINNSSSFALAGASNTTLTITNPNAETTDPIIFNGKRGADSVFRIWGDGSGYYGAQTMGHFGPPRTEFALLSPLVAYLNTDTDAYGNTGIQTYLVTHSAVADMTDDVSVNGSGSGYHRLQTAGANGYVGQVNFNLAFDDSATLEIKSSGGSNGGSSQFTLSAFASQPYLLMKGAASVQGVRLDPGRLFAGTPFVFHSLSTMVAGTLIDANNNGAAAFSVSFDGKISTAAPGGGAGAWKLGKKITATVSAVTTGYIEVEIDGVTYKLGLVT